METCNLIFLFLAFLIGMSSNTCRAFNITKILEKQSDFSSFNQYLSETKLADQINSRSTITILAVDNGGAGSLGGVPKDLMKKMLSVHVVLDYYDTDKLKKLFKSNKSATLTTLFQSTGLARRQQGFITVGVHDGQISFSSAAKSGNNNNVNLVKSVVSQPYNISVLQVGSIINVPDIENTGGPASSPMSAKAPSPSKSKRDDSDSPNSDDEDEALAPSKHKGPRDKSSPPAFDDSDASAPAPLTPSTASRTREIVGGAGLVVMGWLASFLAA